MGGVRDRYIKARNNRRERNNQLKDPRLQPQAWATRKFKGCATRREYFQKTRIFPIMHTVVIRRDVYEKNRWLAQSLYKAFARSQQEVYKDLYETAALKYMLPWLIHHVEETRRVMGDDYWAYGLEPNVNTLETFLRYSYEQWLSKRLLNPRELFAPESLESFKI
jgi:4,5-dihydroxyphthalate decarboxylase